MLEYLENRPSGEIFILPTGALVNVLSVDPATQTALVDEIGRREVSVWDITPMRLTDFGTDDALMDVLRPAGIIGDSLTDDSLRSAF